MGKGNSIVHWAPAQPKRVEHSLQGLRCNRVKAFGIPGETLYLELSVSGSAEDLVRHQLITPQMIEALPRGGYKRFSGCNLFRTARGYRAQIWRDDQDAHELLGRLGLDAMSCEAPARSADVELPSMVGSGSICNRQQHVRWISTGNVLWVDWAGRVREQSLEVSHA